MGVLARQMTDDTYYIKSTIVSVVDEHFPILVKCAFTDQSGKEGFVIDKLPVVAWAVDSSDLDSPQSAFIGCKVLRLRTDVDGRLIAAIDTTSPYAIEAVDRRALVRPLEHGAAQKKRPS